MTEPVAASSDDIRTAKPLVHARSVTIPGPLRLERGGELPEVTIAYETWGTLAPDGGNVVLVCHALSGDSHAARHDPADDPGWWDLLIGPGAPIDTGRCFVVCANVLGGCRGTTGPGSIDPRTGKRYGPDFPVITMGDMVTVQRLLLHHLGITRLRLVVGGSMGGQQALLWAVRHPGEVAAVALLATAHRLSSQSLAFDVVARNAILRDPHYHGGDYYDQPEGPEVGLALARMLGHITYLSPSAMADKFEPDRHNPREFDTAFEKQFSVGSYLAYQGERFVERFDANTYLRLSMALDLFDLGATPEALQAAVAPATCRWLLVSFTSDWLFPSDQSRQLVQALIAAGKPVAYCDVATDAGHDAFLLNDTLPSYGTLVRGMIEPGAVRAVQPGTSLFTQPRLDYERISDLIPAHASVLDLGCGTGGLLARLRERGAGHLMGVELDEAAVVAAVARGLDVVQADLNRGLALFPARSFDVVVLSLTLQAVRDVERVLAEMLRVGGLGIVTFPNAAHRRCRTRLAEQGRAPEIRGSARYHWYNTPDIRMVTVADFDDLCELKGWQVRHRLLLDTAARHEVADDRDADLAVYVLGL